MTIATRFPKSWAVPSFDTKDGSLELYLPLWYPYSDMTGSTIYSYDTNRLSNTVTGATWGRLGRTFDGNDLINMNAALTPLASTTTGTWEVWAMLADATPTVAGTLISFGDTDATELIRILILTTGIVQCEAYKAGTRQWQIKSTAALPIDNTWFHLVLVQNGTLPVIYFNGTQPAQASYDPKTDETAWFSALTGLDNGRIGCDNYGSGGNGDFSVSTIGEVRLYRRVLTLAEVQRNYQVTKWRYS